MRQLIGFLASSFPSSVSASCRPGIRGPFMIAPWVIQRSRWGDCEAGYFALAERELPRVLVDGDHGPPGVNLRAQENARESVTVGRVDFDSFQADYLAKRTTANASRAMKLRGVQTRELTYPPHAPQMCHP